LINRGGDTGGFVGTVGTKESERCHNQYPRERNCCWSL
jgi:hypothetical protein